MIYVASKTKHAEMWKELRECGFPIRSSWIDEAGEGQTKSLAELWNRIDMEVSFCDALILFIQSSDDFPLKGALIETGMAIAYEKPIFVVCQTKLEERTFRPLGSWVNHPYVTVCGTLDEAFTRAQEVVG